MKFKYLFLRNAVFILILTALCSSILIAQKKPAAVNLDPNNDDDRLCGYTSADARALKYDKNENAELRSSQFCNLYAVYVQSKFSTDKEDRLKAKNARNEMIELVLGQVDSYYKFRKKDRRTKIRWFQTILDFLEIGGAAAIAIMNGERAKTIVGVAIAGIQGGRTQFNKNFEVLSTQTLINKMNEKRARIKIDILDKMDRPISGERYAENYSWMAAKNDLRDYLTAGTFDDALDSLVKQTGADAERAERELRVVEQSPIYNEIEEDFLEDAIESVNILNTLNANLAVADKKEQALRTLQDIVAALIKRGGRISTELRREGLTEASSGDEIYRKIIIIKSRINDEPGNEGITNQIDRTIIEENKKNQ